MRDYGVHQDCDVHDPCAAGAASSCPHQAAREKRLFAKQGAWSPLQVQRESGGPRHYLDGQPVHAGEFVELQAIEYRSDDYGEYSAPVQRGTVVRYEAHFEREAPVATLYASIGGHEFVASLQPWMRFRWPQRS